ncbi:thioredoxin-like 1-1, chloroplastic [Benincasa hispida]|uniref:thioredoxin-like 1-1, chloroplastic n=1 Tax=Benincasa hispida TaxID=102211 RepID=UPI0019014FF2|nr:thioredoxin-like 1-1, chloroplastic [Benincasa hispida]
MADALSKIAFAPFPPSSSSICHLHQLPPPSSGLKSVYSSSHPFNWQPLSVKLPPTSRPFSSSHSYCRRIEFTEAWGFSRNSVSPSRSSTISHSGFRIPKPQKWWEKGLQPNMKEVTGAHDLVDSLLNAGDKLVIVDFFSPGCGGCKALHPKICQSAEMYPDIQFLQVNYEEHKSMCYSLGVHVLPFFRFYRGAQGRLCSFSCTNATIKKFKDALAKHNTDRCSLGPTQGLEEKDLVALAANKELSFNYMPKPAEEVPIPIPATVEGVRISESKRSRSDLEQLPLPLPSTILKSAQGPKENAYVG